MGPPQSCITSVTSPQVQLLEERDHGGGVFVVGVPGLVGGLIGASEAGKVGRYATVSGVQATDP